MEDGLKPWKGVEEVRICLDFQAAIPIRGRELQEPLGAGRMPVKKGGRAEELS